MRKFFLIVVLILTFALRLYKIDNPVADWHSWRQADTAAVAQNFTKFGFDPLRPRYDDLSNIASGQDNPMGWRMVEFPLYQLIAAGLFKIFDAFSIEEWLRLVTIFAAVGSVYFIYRIGENLINYRFGTIAAFIFATLPYSIYYGRTILPEPIAVFFALGAVYFFVKNNTRSLYVFYSLSAIFGALALLVKPTAGFVLLPLMYLAWNKHGIKKLLKSPWTYLYLFSVFAPLALWRWWIENFPEGIPAYEWLLNGDGIRLKGAWFYWLFGERIAKLILGFWGIALLSIGIVAKKIRKEGYFFYWLGAGALLYLVILATGNVKHDYYQIIIIPAIVFFVAKGSYFLLSQAGKVLNTTATYLLLVTCYLLLVALSWHEVRTFYWINNQAIIETGIAADKLLPANAKVIAPYGGDTAFLYQTNRQGWPVGFEIEDKVKKGATHYVSVTPDDPEVLYVQEKYKTIKQTDSYVIVKLQ